MKEMVTVPDFLVDEIRGPLIVTPRGTKKQALVRTIITEGNIPQEKLIEIAGQFPVVVFGPGKLVEIFAFRFTRNSGMVVHDSDMIFQDRETDFVVDFNRLMFHLEHCADHAWNFDLIGRSYEIKIRIFHHEPKISSDELLEVVLDHTFPRILK